MKYFVLKFAISDKGGMKNDMFSFLDIYFITFSLDHNVKHCWLVGCFGFKDPLRLFQSISGRPSKRGRKRRKDIGE